MEQTRETRIAYLAGYFDRSACITASPSHFPLVILSSGSQDILHLMQSELAAAELPNGKIKTFYDKSSKTKRYQLMIGGTDTVRMLLRGLLPFLRVRAKEAHLLLSLISLGEQSHTDENTRQRNLLSDALRDEKKRRGTFRQKRGGKA